MGNAKMQNGGKRLDSCDLSVANIGSYKKVGKIQRWVIRTKKRIGGAQLHSHYRMFLGVPSAFGVHGFCGHFPSEDEALKQLPIFLRILNGKRDFPHFPQSLSLIINIIFMHHIHIYAGH